MILNRVIRPSWQELRDLHPLIPQAGVGAQERLILFHRPALLFDVRVQLIEPALAALRVGWENKGEGSVCECVKSCSCVVWTWGLVVKALQSASTV